MTENERDRLVRLETLLPQVEKVLEKILENQEILPLLRMEAEANKKFREEFAVEVTKMVSERLNTATFENGLSAHIESQVMIILNRKEVRKTFKQDVVSIFEEEYKTRQLSFFWKVVGVVASIATIIVTVVLQSMAGG